MRVRVALRALWALWDMRHLLNPLRYGVRSVQIFSHKVLRYFAFVPMVTLLASSVWLAGRSPLYGGALVLQIALYAIAAAGWSMRGGGRLLGVPYYFLLLNVTAAHAVLEFVKGERRATWTPRVG